MKTIKVLFTEIVKLRQFELSLQFLSFSFETNEETMEVEIDMETVRPQYKIEISCNSASVTFRAE